MLQETVGPRHPAYLALAPKKAQLESTSDSVLRPPSSTSSSTSELEEGVVSAASLLQPPSPMSSPLPLRSPALGVPKPDSPPPHPVSSPSLPPPPPVAVPVPVRVHAETLSLRWLLPAICASLIAAGAVLFRLVRFK